jgi:tetrahydromethanopterin S-methyltransferase subunit G
VTGLTEQERQWGYSGKEIAEMFSGMKEDIAELRVEMRETKTLIRDYNGLRKRLNKCEQRIEETAGQSKGSKDMWGYIVGGIGLLFAILSQAVR